jgi:hypothetical protein
MARKITYTNNALFSPSDDEGIKQFEANGRDDDQIHGGNVRRVVVEKSAPSLAWRPAPLDHVFGDA